MTTQELKLQTRKQLADLARNQGVQGWHSMRKEDLVSVLVKKLRRSTSKNTKADSNPKHNGLSQKHPTSATVERGILSGTRHKNRQMKSSSPRQLDDSLRAEVCNCYWVQLAWELSSKTLSRAESALSSEWLRSTPILRTFELLADQNDSDRLNRTRDIEIFGDSDSWFLQIEKPGSRYQFVLGYLAPSGRFFSLAKSGIVQTPKPGAQGSLERAAIPQTHNQTRHKEYRVGDSNVWRIGEFNTQKSDPLKLAYGTQKSAQDRDFGEYRFRLDAEVTIHGISQPGSSLSVHGEPVQLREDGSFSVKYSLPNGRHVIPFVSICPLTGDHHTQILALERNTKELEVLSHDDV